VWAEYEEITKERMELLKMIHESAIVGDDVTLGDNVVIGPYTVIEGNIDIGADTVIHERVSIKGNTIIGRGNTIYPGVTIGLPPQDNSYNGEPTRVTIGDNNVLREYATIHAGVNDTTPGTIIGCNNMLMTHTHVAHNCELGSHVTMANNAQISGYNIIEDHAVLGGFVGTHQFVRIGAYSMSGGYSYCMQDVPPCMMVFGSPAKVVGLNKVPLQGSEFTAEDRSALKTAHRILFRSDLPWKQACARVEEELSDAKPVQHLLEFMQHSKRGICRGKKNS